MRIIKDYDTLRICEELLKTELFKNTSKNTLSAAVESIGTNYIEYDDGEVIYSPRDTERKAICFLSGYAEIFSADESRSVLLRTVGKGGIIGVANLFSQERFVSRVIAAKKCAVLEISAEVFGRIIESDRQAMYNYIAFLSKKIRYLNRKIVCLTAGSAERRLAYFLDSYAADIPDTQEYDRIGITVQMNSLCEMLNLGRASLYRAADKLCEEGYIEREGKTIYISDRNGMMEKYG